MLIRQREVSIHMKDEMRVAPESAQRWLLGVLGSLTTTIVMLFTMIMMWTLAVGTDTPDGWRWWGPLPLMASVSVGLLVTAELLCLRHRLVTPQHPYVLTGSPRLRTVAVVAVAAAVLLLHSWNPLGAVPLGAVAGAELAIRRAGRIDMVSTDQGPVQRRLRVGRSSVVLVVTALVVSLVVSILVPAIMVLLGEREIGPGTTSGGVVNTALTAKVFVTLLLAGGTALAVLHGLCRLGHKLAEEVAGYLRGVRQSHLRYRAQWMHDQLLSEISFMMLEFQSRPTTDEWAVGRLRDLDHRLRVQQIGDLIESGPTRIASLVQVHIRRSMNLGVAVSSVPEFQHVDVMVDSDTGRLINRVLSTLFSNAMNAGAQEIGLDVRVHAAGVEIRVSDDAGGFDLHRIPVGRGLEELISELGRDGVSRQALPGGSLMTVIVPHRLMCGVGGPEPAPEMRSSLRRGVR
jgi:signal transduction histidine kinase